MSEFTGNFYQPSTINKRPAQPTPNTIKYKYFISIIEAEDKQTIPNYYIVEYTTDKKIVINKTQNDPSSYNGKSQFPASKLSTVQQDLKTVSCLQTTIEQKITTKQFLSYNRYNTCYNQVFIKITFSVSAFPSSTYSMVIKMVVKLIDFNVNWISQDQSSVFCRIYFVKEHAKQKNINIILFKQYITSFDVQFTLIKKR